MSRGILGRKLGMTQIFDESGRAVAVTVIEAGPCRVVAKRTPEQNRYRAVQLGFEEARPNRVTRAEAGHAKKAGVPTPRVLREIRTVEGRGIDGLQVGETVRADVFQVGDRVDVTGISKGKGFAGTVKRWNFNRGPMSHGSMYHRRVGSLNATDPQRVFKGRKMPGRMGGKRRTVQSLQVVQVDPERNLLLVQGAVPGPRRGLLIIRESVRTR
ncbi:50S ribosomal protein L3 [Limnochorda pilosa]|uniref:Large ribosomal subunit protein uL3 n=1 Tax=Limnochorda pilosa TaxID=1555112 RepID=A0A0K2SPM7_LIMPI|nr:50S ribosomal protein L3 [Limnochorda pilosa]BAS29088.1 50S ribosomal protein L3 [Limnochorda pilosa]